MKISSQRKGVWAINPIKPFARAKERLGDLLNIHERSTLAKAMAADVLEKLSRTCGLSGVLVVTSDADAHALAADFGALVASDAIEPGINAAVQRGIETVSRLHENPAIMVVPADIPLVSVDELSEVVTALETADVVLAEAARDGGTNILGLSRPGIIRPSFGPRSFSRHTALAYAAGIEPLALSLKGAGHDIDIASDLTLDPSLVSGPRTLAWLTGFRNFASPRHLELVTE